MNVIKFPRGRVARPTSKTTIQAEKSCGNCDHHRAVIDGEPRCMHYPSNRLGTVTTLACVPETRLLWAPKRSWLKKVIQATIG